MIGRAAEHPECQLRDHAMPDHAPLQVVARARAQEIDGVAGAVLLVAHDVAVGRIRLHVVDGGDGRGGVAEGGMAGDVVHLLAADIDDAAVAQRFQMFLARPQHRRLLVIVGSLPCRIAAARVHRRSSKFGVLPSPELGCRLGLSADG